MSHSMSRSIASGSASGRGALGELLRDHGVEDISAHDAMTTAILNNRFPDSPEHPEYVLLRGACRMGEAEFAKEFEKGLLVKEEWNKREAKRKSKAKVLSWSKKGMTSRPETPTPSRTRPSESPFSAPRPTALPGSARPSPTPRRPAPPVSTHTSDGRHIQFVPDVAEPRVRTQLPPLSPVCAPLRGPECTLVLDAFNNSGLKPPAGFEIRTLHDLAETLAQEKGKLAVLREERKTSRKAKEEARLAKVRMRAEADRSIAKMRSGESGRMSTRLRSAHNSRHVRLSYKSGAVETI
ncbi:MAG: hypothetical protein M4579_006221 [Chaenotheca gracillima]|nr:MAG: hypothetical protein M4579_006221 [Chaenotheca gracillima]